MKKAVAKSSTDHTPDPAPHPGLCYRIGDLLWCQEARNNRLWWPAMVTYDPKLGIFFRVIKHKVLQYHVQYFGISAIRGWVTGKSCVAFNDKEEKKFDVDCLPKKTRSEYEMALQEVDQAKDLDYKQRKLKFIFSFGPPQKSKKSKTSSSESSEQTPVKVEVKKEVETTASSGKQNQQKSDKKNNKRRSISSLGATPDLVPRAKHRRSPSSQETPSRARTSNHSLPLSGSPHDSKERTKRRKSSTKVNTPQVPSPPCLHDQHSQEPRRRRSSSDSSLLDCDECMDYICRSDSQPLTCDSELEKVEPLDIEGSSKTIVMYVQKEYHASKRGRPPKSTSIPSRSTTLTKGTPTKNAITETLDSVPESGARSNSNAHPGQQHLTPTVSTKLSSSLGSLGSDSSCEAGRNGQPVTAGVKRKRKGSSRDVLSPPGVGQSNLLVAQTMTYNNGAEGEESNTRRIRHSRTSSLSGPSSTKEESLSAEEGTVPAAKRMQMGRRRNSEQGAAPLPENLLARRSSRLQSLSGPVTNGSSVESTGASGVDSGSEASLTPMVLTPTASSPASSSIEIDTAASDTAASVSSGPISKPVKKRSKPTIQMSPADVVSTCSICECEDTDLLVCGGYCSNSFHLDCLGLVERPAFNFVCDECMLSSGSCFACGKADKREVIKCSKSKCSKLYHLDCIKNNKLFQFGKGSSFTCALHVCAKCTSIGGLPNCSGNPSKSLLQCVKCPLALHQPDCVIAGSKILDHTHMICYQHVKIMTNTKLYSHINLNTCLECGSIGSLYCCDTCSAAYHLECLDEEARPQGDNSWKCPSCAVHDLPTYNSLVVTKFGKWRWWPSEVVPPDDVPDNLHAKNPGECMFVVRFCGSKEFCWTYHGRVIPYTEEAEPVDGMRKKVNKLPEKYQQACEEASEIYKIKVQEREAEARQAQVKNSKYYCKIKTNKYLVPRPHIDQDAVDFFPCQCTKENPCNDASTCVNRASHFECTPSSCTVGDLCQNKRMQKFQNAKTEPFYTGNRGWGLKASTNLSKGDFVIEYVGEVLDEAMCRERIKKAQRESDDNFYMLTLDVGLVIDAGRKSNHARFINHSCSPNCETQKWRVRGEPRIGIFVREEIQAGTELTFDYQLDSLGNEKKQCHCGSKNCSGFLGERKAKVGERKVKAALSEEERKIKVKVKKKKPKPKPRQPTRDEDEEDAHDDACFICRDGGKLLMCDRKFCTRSYHLACLSRKLIPPESQKWECPWHFCSKCQKPSEAACSMCPESYCSKHAANKLFKPSQLNIEAEVGKVEGILDDEGISVSKENMLLCEGCLKDATETVSGENVTEIVSGESAEMPEVEVKKEETASGSEKVEKAFGSENVGKAPGSEKVGKVSGSEKVDNEAESNKVVKSRSSSSQKLSSSKGTPSKKSEQKAEQKSNSKSKKPPKVAAADNVKAESKSGEAPVASLVEDERGINNNQQQEPAPAVPLAVIQSGTTQQQPSKKKKKPPKETGRRISPHFSPPPDLHRSPLDSYRGPPPLPIGVAASDKPAQSLSTDSRFNTVVRSPSSVSARKLSPEPHVDVVCSPQSQPQLTKDQRMVPHRSGLEELLQQSNPAPSQQLQLQQQQQHQQQPQQLQQQPTQQLQQQQQPAQQQLQTQEQSSYNVFLPRSPECQMSSSAFRPGSADTNNSLNKTMTPPLFQPPHGSIGSQISSPALAGGSPGYPSAVIDPSSTNKFTSGFVGATAGLMRPPTGFQQPQQTQPFNSVWFVPNRNGFVNGLDPAAGGFGYPSYQPAAAATFIAPNPLGLSYPTYFPDASMSTFDTFSGNVGAHHQQLPPASSATPSSSVPPTSAAVFPSVLPSGPQNFFQWK